MATAKKTETNPLQDDFLLLEQRKVKALEKISNSLDALTVWFEEIEKQDHYLSIAAYHCFARDGHSAVFIRTKSFGY